MILNPLLNIAGALAGSELDDPKLGQMVLVERILCHDLLDLPACLADRQDDPAIARNLAARDEEVAGRAALLQKRDVRRHVGVDFGKGTL